ncbi:MAG: YHS domain-containing protein, partial [Haliea sp.]
MTTEAAVSDQTRDPVCGMTVDPATAKHHSEHKGQTWYFCAARCREKFEADPEQYLSEKKEPEAAIPGAIYTCPMHPEVRQEGPGDCPECGMALEPEEVTADTGPSAELLDMSRRFWIGLVLHCRFSCWKWAAIFLPPKHCWLRS